MLIDTHLFAVTLWEVDNLATNRWQSDERSRAFKPQCLCLSEIFGWLLGKVGALKLERSEYVPPTEKGLFMVRHIWEGQEQKYVVRSADEIVERRTVFTNLEPEVLSMINWEKFEKAIKNSKISDKEKAMKEKQRGQNCLWEHWFYCRNNSFLKRCFQQVIIAKIFVAEADIVSGLALGESGWMKPYNSSSNGQHKKAYGGSSNGQHNASTKEKPKEVTHQRRHRLRVIQIR
ncbi:hypothetical protein SELMODRAFT_424879 [Selaginella moellendorffii]|uniref:Uncharacterized protein n=1 Tax=Selaginella moellendorffii TaxID=88036 RepID=D8SRA9_SELML|nr:hypothetical protein SELMODRAFT_424879 [Selaginella moellendorffii]